MEGNKNQEFVSVSKNIWPYLLKQKVTITAKYLPGSKNSEADWASRQKKELKRVETKPRYLQILVSGHKYFRNRPNCVKGVTPTISIHVMEGGSLKSGEGCIPALLGSQVCLCVPLPFSLQKEGLYRW